jgi:hypothetical protein
MTTPIKVEQVDIDLAAALEAECVMVDYDYLGFDEKKAAEMIAAIRIAAEAKTREEDARIAERFDGCNGCRKHVAQAIRSRMETDNGR